MHAYRLLVLEPDPRKIEKEGLVNWLGWKCTLHQVCRRTSDWLLNSILMCVFISQPWRKIDFFPRLR